MEYIPVLKFINYICIAVFFIFVVIYSYLCIRFNSFVQKHDETLYEKVKLKLASFNMPFYNFITKKEFLNLENTKIKNYCQKTFYVGWVMQWGFNLFIVTTVLIYVFSL